MPGPTNHSLKGSQKEMTMTDNPLSTLRKQLIANGYVPVPGKDRQCRLKGWNSDFPAREIKRYGSLPAAAESWDTRFPKHKTTNIRIEGGLCAIDADVDDAALAA